MSTGVHVMQLRDGDLLSNGDAAKQLGLSTSMVNKLAVAGRLKAIRTRGGFKLFLASDIEALAAARSKTKKARGR